MSGTIERREADRPTSFAQQEIVAPLQPAKGVFIYVAKEDF